MSQKGFLVKTLNFFVSLVAGKSLGKRFPILWKVYDEIWRLLSPKAPFYHVLAGNKFLVDPNEPIRHVREWMQSYLMHDEYEPETTAIVSRIVKPGEIAVDIGASIGYFSMLFSRIVGQNGRVFSFEPTREGFKYLCENRIANNAWNISPYNLAAWDKDEPVRMPKSSYAKNAQWANGVSVSEFLSWLGVRSVDFVKIDVDGAEPWVLKGLEPLIANSPNLKMVIEYYPKYILASDGNPKDVLDILNRYFTYRVIENDYGDGYWNYFCERKTS